MTLQEYLKQHQMKLSTFAKIYNLDYHRLFRVKQGAITRDSAIQAVFEQLDIVNEIKESRVNRIHPLSHKSGFVLLVSIQVKFIVIILIT